MDRFILESRYTTLLRLVFRKNHYLVSVYYTLFSHSLANTKRSKSTLMKWLILLIICQSNMSSLIPTNAPPHPPYPINTNQPKLDFDLWLRSIRHSNQSMYVWESTTNFKTWTPVRTNQMFTNGQWLTNKLNVTNKSVQYFRLRLQ